MKTVFIADGHLKGPADPNSLSLVKFLDSLKQVSTLVILGDLFDFWTGSNETVERNYRPVLDALLRLKERGVKIIYIEGNHDFSMGRYFTETLKANVHSESLDFSIDGKRLFLAHGDTVSMSPGYRLWRAYLRSPLFRLMAWIARPKNVWKIAMGLSDKSRKKTYTDKSNRTDAILREFAGKKLAEGFSAVVLAHSHVAGVHREGKGVYANPGSWANDMSYLVYDKGGFRVERWKG